MKILILTTCWLSVSLQPLWAQVQTAHKVEDKEAKRLISEFTKTIKANRKSLTPRIKAVQSLGRFSNALLVKPLLMTARSDKAKSVRQAAALAIGSQPPKQARTALNMLLKKTSITSEPNVTAAIIKAFDRGSYRDKDYKTFKGLFDRSLSDQRCVAAQIAVLEMFGHQKEVQAAKYLAMHIDAPAPAWVDDPSNPPASYWQGRYKNWQKWRSHLKEALFQITGQRFSSNKGARAWLKKNLDKLQRSANAAKRKSSKKKKKR